MERINKSLPTSFITLGIVFMILGLVQLGFSISFESGFFTLGLLFVLGGLVAFILKNRSRNAED
jgi:uncharacterized membrane protein